MKVSWGFLSALLLLLPALTAGCAARKAVVQPSVPPADDPDRGKSSMAFLRDPHAEPPKLGPNERFEPPRPFEELRLPEYPPDALDAGEPPASLFLRITIGASGRVELIEDSPLGTTSPGPFAEQFRWAAIRAIRAWRFSPGRINRLIPPRPGDEDVERVESGPPVDIYYDVRFDFHIVNGKGQVKSTLGSGAPG